MEPDAKTDAIRALIARWKREGDRIYANELQAALDALLTAQPAEGPSFEPIDLAQLVEQWTASHKELMALRLALYDGGKPAEGWQPIETAPKDGTFVLLRSPYGVRLGGWNAGSGWLSLNYGEPSLWMRNPPLPDPPKEPRP